MIVNNFWINLIICVCLGDRRVWARGRRLVDENGGMLASRKVHCTLEKKSERPGSFPRVISIQSNWSGLWKEWLVLVYYRIWLSNRFVKENKHWHCGFSQRLHDYVIVRILTFSSLILFLTPQSSKKVNQGINSENEIFTGYLLNTFRSPMENCHVHSLPILFNFITFWVT